MPKVLFTQEQKLSDKNKKFNKWLKGKLASEDITMSMLAKELEITPPALSQRFKNNSSFTYEQMLVIFRITQTEDEEIIKLMRF